MEGKRRRIFKHRTFKKGRKMKFSELGLPGVECVPTPHESISLALSVPPRPKTANFTIFMDLGGTPARALWSPLKGLNGVRGQPFKRAAYSSQK